MPWRMAAARMGSSRSTAKLRPLGCTVTVKVIGLGARSLRLGRESEHREFCPSAPCPSACACPARFRRATPADRRLRRRRPARGAAAARPLARARAHLHARRAAPSCAPPASRRWSATSTSRPRCARLAGLADAVLHLAPPPRQGDERPAHARTCCRRWRAAARVRRLVYGSTSGVYGDCGGARFDETRAVAPGHRPRAPPRRCRARAALASAAPSARASRVLRIPGIYAARPRRRPPARAPGARHAGAARRGRRLHQPHPRRRPGARLRGRAAPRRCRSASCTPATTPS